MKPTFYDSNQLSNKLGVLIISFERVSFKVSKDLHPDLISFQNNWNSNKHLKFNLNTVCPVNQTISFLDVSVFLSIWIIVPKLVSKPKEHKQKTYQNSKQSNQQLQGYCKYLKLCDYLRLPGFTKNILSAFLLQCRKENSF